MIYAKIYKSPTLKAHGWTKAADEGQVSEWFKEPVLKTGDTATYRGFESHPVRQNIFITNICGFTQVVKGLPC